MIIKELDKLSYPKNVKYFNSVHPHSKEYANTQHKNLLAFNGISN
jgi:hypothetical protein